MITAVTTCMGRREHLETTLPLMLKEFDQVVVVDWSCPQDSGSWALTQGADVVWKRGKRYFNAAQARNAGARAVTNRTVCFIDADTLVMSGIKSEIESLIDLSSMVIAARNSQGVEIHDLGGFIAVDIGQFWGVKGYNESIEGYCMEDSYLRAQLCLERGLKAKRVSPGMLAAMRHTHELRGRYHKDPIAVGAKRNYEVLTSYLKSRGVDDWFSDPRTAEVAHRTA